jgi:regulator of sigma E protease
MPQLQNVLSFIVLLGVLVTVHELGHFLVAKACGVKVLKFSIGFGPKLVGFTKGETEYQIALLPLGGYVKMAGDMPHEELSPEEASRGFLAQPPWKRGLIVLAGPAFNLLFPIFVYFFVFLGPHPATSSLVGSVSPGMPAAAAGIRPGDRILSVNNKEVSTFGEMVDAFEGHFDGPIPIVVERNEKPVTVQVTPVNTVEESFLETRKQGKIGVEALPKPSVVGVLPGSVAEQAGLRTFDRILSIKDVKDVKAVPVQDEARLNQELGKYPEGTLLQLTVRRLEPLQVGAVTARAARVLEVTVPKQAGEGLASLGLESADPYIATVVPGSAAEKAGLRPGDRLVSLDGKPVESFHQFAASLSTLKEQPFTLTWRGERGERTEQVAQAPLERLDEMGNPTRQVMLGVAGWDARYVDRTAEDKVTVYLGPAEAFKQAALIVPRYVGLMVKVIGGLFVGSVPLSTVGGPIMMYQMAAKSAEQGLDAFLNLMALISINLGVVNLLPIPVLDGFHLLSAAWEGIRRRPIPVRVREVANMVGLALLIMLMLLAVSNDIMR